MRTKRGVVGGALDATGLFVFVELFVELPELRIELLDAILGARPTYRAGDHDDEQGPGEDDDEDREDRAAVSPARLRGAARHRTERAKLDRAEAGDARAGGDRPSEVLDRAVRVRLRDRQRRIGEHRCFECERRFFVALLALQRDAK